MLRQKVRFDVLKDYNQIKAFNILNSNNVFIFEDDCNNSNKGNKTANNNKKENSFLEPIKQKVKNIEQERILAVFDQLIQRVSILAALPSIINTFEEFHLLVGAHLVCRIQRYTELKTEYDFKSKKLDAIRNYNDRRLSEKRRNGEDSFTYDEQSCLIPKSLQNLPDLQISAQKPKRINSGENGEQTFSLKRSAPKHSNIQLKEEATKEVMMSDATQPTEANKPSKTENDCQKMESERSDKIMESQDSGPLSLEEMEKMMWKQDAVEKKLKCMVPPIQRTVRFILQGFKKNPSATNAVIHHCKVWFIERSEGSTEILNELEKLRKVIVASLLTSPEDQREKDEYLENLIKRENIHKEKIITLETILNEAQERRKKAVDEKNKYIIELQNQYHILEKVLIKSLNLTNIQANEKKNAALETSTQKKEDLKNQLQGLKKEFQKLMEINRESEYKLRSRKWKFENELEAIIQKHDHIIGDKNTEYEDIEAEYKVEKNQLEILEENFKVMEAEYNQVMEDRYQQQLKEQRKREEERMLLESAVTIQAFYRSFKARRQLKKGRKKKK